jgi:putative ABC transport system permease protein
MISLMKLAFRNTMRNGRRTLLTAATVTIGTAFVVITLSFLNGLFGGMINNYTALNGSIRVVTAEYAEREQLAPLHENIEQVEALLATVRAAHGIADAAPMIRTGVIISIGEEIGEDGTLLTGSSQQWYEQHLLPNATLIEGAWLDPNAKDEQVVVGAKIARNVGIKVGDSVLLMGTTQHGSMAPISADVVGVLSGNASIDSQSFVTLQTARWMTDIPDGALEIAVYADDSSELGVGAAARALREVVGDQHVVTPWFERSMWVQMKPVVDGMNTIMSAIIIFIMSLAVFNTMTMSVLERTGEIGVMRAMGQSRLSAVVSFLFESVLIGLTGGALGALIGAIPALYLQIYGVSFAAAAMEEMDGEYPVAAVMYADFSIEIVLTALFVGVATAALGAFFPSLRAARIAPFEAMRQR